MVHVADATGKAITQTLTDQVLDNGNIELFNDRVAIDLINLSTLGRHHSRCAGAYVLNRSTGRVEVFQSRFVILATGGASKVYLYTSNPDSSTGDGIAMAWRAGCRVANMEFNQFHPTCLYHPHAGSFLISEAVRGEGGVLRLPSGQRFMQRFDERRELAPRDIVARAIDHEIMGVPMCRTYTLLARLAALACMVPIGSPVIRCLNVWFMDTERHKKSLVRWISRKMTLTSPSGTSRK